MQPKKIIEAICARAGGTPIEEVFFVACGGSLAGLYPAWYLLSREARHLRAVCYTSNEFVHATPAACGERSIVICCSLASTPETVAASRKARELGAHVIALVGEADAEMAQIAQHAILYHNLDARRRDTDPRDTKLSWALKLAFELLHQQEGYAGYHEAMQAFDLLPPVAMDALRYSDRRVDKFARMAETEKIIYVMGSGPNCGSVYSHSICNILECMWTDSVAVHSGEYFHGPFETTDQNLAVILLVSGGRTRALDERALRFLQRHTDKLTVVDAKTFGIDRMGPAVREYFEPLVFMPVMDIYNTALARLRGHSEKDRRYMYKLPY